MQQVRLRVPALARIGKNALALVVAQAGARVLNLLLLAQVTRALGTAALGRYLLAMTVQAIVLAVTDLGLNTYTVREWAKQAPSTTDERWGMVLMLKLAAALCGVVILNLVVAPLLFAGERQVLLAIVSLSLLPDALSGIVASLIKARQRMELSSGIQLGLRFLYALSGVVLVWLGYGERALLALYSAVSLLGAAVSAGVLRAWRVGVRLPAPGRTWREVLRESTPFAITSMVTMLYTRLDLLMVSLWQGDVAAGRYGAAYRLWEVLGLVPSSFLDALFPELASLGGEPGLARLWALYRRGRRILWLPVFLIAILGELAAPAVMRALYGNTPDTSASTAIFRVLLLAYPFTYLYLLNGHVLYAAGRQRWVAATMAGVTAANAVLNALLIPRWSYWGAAGVALTSELLLFVWLQLGVRRRVMPRPGGENR